VRVQLPLPIRKDKMKTILLITAAAALLLTGSGCASARKTDNARPVKEDPLQRVQRTLETGAYIAAGWHLIDNPEDRGEIEDIAAQLEAVSSAESFVDIASKFAGRDDKTRLIIGGGLLLFEQELEKVPIPERPAFITETAARFRKGLARALGEAK
jgi:hypothetical protein